jgi:trehalose 6-phosphate phosphatase
VRLLDRLDRELGDGAGLVAIFDYDGTLTPLVSTPEAAVLAPSVRATLRRLAASDRARLAILSGRGLADLRRRVALKGVVYGGCHGLEISGRQLRFRHPRARASGIAATRRELADALPELPGARLEFKGLALTLHYRAVRPERWPEVEQIAASVLRRRRDLTAIQGHRIFDFMPRVGWNKGQAARWMVKRMASTLPNGRAVVLYAGDDTTDESAFTALRGRALTIRVGTSPTAAHYTVRGVRDVQVLLRWMAGALAA